ncbi:MAG: NAD(P)-binding protein [Lachnospiraceae bacterium]|nr:NAD(P)-binding protein [Lachnospiraceae bacterium]
MKLKYIIIGAGAAGLSFAATLKANGEDSFVILEKEKESGGLCRSTIYDGAPIDIGGGHILDVRNKPALDFLFSYMPEEEWNVYERITKTVVGEHSVSYPLEANIWQFPLELQLDYLESISQVQHRKDQPIPEKFKDWIYWKFGDIIAKTYMLPYNEKLWSLDDLNELGTYWLYKLPDVSFRETLLSCLNRAPSGTLPHARFYYPKKTGYGEVFLRIAATIKEHIRYNYLVNYLEADSLKVNNEYQADYIINTAPWHEFPNELTDSLKNRIKELKYTSVDIDYQPLPSADRETHWTYYADLDLPYHRIVNRDNIVSGATGYWTETNSKRRKNPSKAHWENKYSYPLNTLNKPKAIAEILAEAKRLNIIGLGRWGEWEHMNSDLAVTRGIELAKKMLGK